MQRRAPIRPGTMNTNRPAPDAVALLLAVALEVAEALAVLAVAALALLLTLARWRPAPAAVTPPPPPAPTVPAVHPLAVVAASVFEGLEALTVAELRRRARAAGLPRNLSRTGRRAALLPALAGLEVAACS